MPKYSEFAHKIDMDDFYAEIGFEVMQSRGDEDMGRCLDLWGLHSNGDQTGKLAFNREKRVYNCFVCGGGSLLSFVMDLKGISPDEATDWLYRFATERDRTDEEFVDDIREILSRLDRPKREKIVLPYFNVHVLTKWMGEGGESDWWDERPYEWLDDRKINHDVAYCHRIGFDPQATKWAPRGKDGKPIAENYTGPAMVFPLYWDDRLVGWQHRWLEDDRPKWVPKYTNTPDFPKRYTLWNYTRPLTSHALPPVVVESVPTALMIESMGWPAIATFGASATPEQMKLLRRFQQGLIFAPDNDGAGLKGFVEMAEYLEDFIPISYIDPTSWPPKWDLGDYAKNAPEVGRTSVRHLIENPIRIA